MKRENVLSKTLVLVAVGSIVGLAGTAVATAAALGLSGLAARDEFDNGGHHDQETHDRAVNLRFWANVSWAAAGLFAVAGGFLLWKSGSKPASSAPNGALGSVSIGVPARHF